MNFVREQSMWEIHCSSRAVHQRFTNSPRNVHIHIVFAVLSRVRLKFHKRCISIRTAITVLSQPFNKCFAMRDNVFTNIPQTIHNECTKSLRKSSTDRKEFPPTDLCLKTIAHFSHTFHTRFTQVLTRFSHKNTNTSHNFSRTYHAPSTSCERSVQTALHSVWNFSGIHAMILCSNVKLSAKTMLITRESNCENPLNQQINTVCSNE